MAANGNFNCRDQIRNAKWFDDISHGTGIASAFNEFAWPDASASIGNGEEFGHGGFFLFDAFFLGGGMGG